MGRIARVRRAAGLACGPLRPGASPVTAGTPVGTPRFQPRLLIIQAGEGGCEALPAGLGLHTLVCGPDGGQSPARIVDLAQRIEDAHAQGMQGTVVVLRHGVLEEVAFILDLLVGGDAPVVAMAGPASGGTGDAALRMACDVAVNPGLRGLGTLVVQDGAIHAARFVEQRSRGTRPGFVSPGGRLLGACDGGQPKLRHRPARLPVFPRHGGEPRPVALLRWAMGDDGRRLGSLPALGFAGAVVEAAGPGQIPDEAVPRLGALATHMPVVLAAREGDGRLADRGLIPAGCLSALKARLLLGFALRGGAGHAVAASAFAPYGMGGAGPPAAHAAVALSRRRPHRAAPSNQVT